MACAELGAVLAKIKAALQCNRVREEFHNENINLAEFEGTLSNLKAMIFDANSSNLIYDSSRKQEFIKRVRAAVSDADDSLDEVNIPFPSHSKARRSSSNSCSISITRQFNNIKTKLDALMIESCQLSPPVPNYDRYCGREVEKDDIVGMLLSGKADACFVSIVGMAGIGKTYLAGAVFDDHRVKSTFKLRLWVSVADNNSQDLSLRSVFEKILRDGLQHNVDVSGYTTDWMLKTIEEKIGGKRYLLVLDDVWCESSTLWYDFRQFVRNHGNGSRVLITSRSKIVASVIRSRYTHELERLSQIDSIEMFNTISQPPDDENPIFLSLSAYELNKKSSRIPLIIEAISQVKL